MGDAEKRGNEMKYAQTVVVLFSMMMLGVPTGSLAERGVTWKGSGGWGADSPHVKLYNPQTVQTMSGEVLSVSETIPMKGMSPGVHLMVKTDTDKETLSIHLGPGWYVENQDVKIEPKDRIEVTGSRITFKGQPAIVAAEVRKGDDILRLRDESGVPLWSGWRRRS
ncbi:MAG: DNA-binding protein [Nitrospirota bacterium]